MIASPAPRVVLYTRISEDSDASTSVERQRLDLEAHAAREGWTVVATLTDEGISGRRSRAKALEGVAMLREDRADILAVWKLDRFSRAGLPALVALFDVLEHRAAARFLCLRDGLDSASPLWRVNAVVLAEVARAESENTRTRVRSSIAHLRAQDRYAGGNLPSGYRSVPHPSGKGRALEVDPEAAAVLLEAAENIISGSSLRTEVLRMNAEGRLRPRRADQWRVLSLRRALTEHSVVGRVMAHGEVLTDPATNLPRQVWPPALPLDVWHAVRAAVDGRGRSTPYRARQARSRLLSGLLFCAGCQRPLYQRPGGKGAALTYACQTRSQGLPCAGPVAVTCDRVEEHVRWAFLASAGDEPVVIYRPDAGAADAPAVADLRDAVEALQGKAMAARGPARQAIMGQLEVLEERLDAEQARPASEWDRWVETGETYGKAFEGADLERQRALLRDQISRIVIGPGRRGRGFDSSRVGIEWRDPDRDYRRRGN